MKKILSPLRYPGSKIKLVKYLSKVLEFNHFEPKILVEPFVGGGSVFLNFIENGWVERVIIGDKDKLVFSFWKVLFENPQHLIKFVKKIKVNTKNFAFYKNVALNESRYSENKLAEACLFLNRTSFSGILANSAGPIGGKKQESEYKINCRFNKKIIIQKIEKISSFAPMVTVLPFDWNRTINYALRNNSKAKLFFYLDPPFFQKADKLYRHYFEKKDLHQSLNRKLKSLNHKWVLSYDRAPEIKEMYKPFIQRSFAFPYSINSPARRIEKEYFITSKNLKRPSKNFLQK